MLNGVGGNTIAAAKEAMTVREFRQWVKFRNTRGSLFTSRRIEQSLARVCELICAAGNIKKDSDAGTTFRAVDFMPNEDAYLTREPEMTLDDYVKLMVD